MILLLSHNKKNFSIQSLIIKIYISILPFPEEQSINILNNFIIQSYFLSTFLLKNFPTPERGVPQRLDEMTIQCLDALKSGMSSDRADS
ncbi:hypothetical protein CSA56_09760 [candidate division KSB3 bacterium]|uniref:Uncharacterized protein n=1 Tax=candidate division KSB3 bacterium TaxID=2044937 RepID=A0A2G6KEI3_9BACT|nr:MAG: hypothetical protein CSA56_09760 [candidate division KSB3 bacterium]